MILKKLEKIDICARRHALDVASEALSRALDDLDDELTELQQVCKHPDEVCTFKNGMVSHYCEDCGLVWTSDR